HGLASLRASLIVRYLPPSLVSFDTVSSKAGRGMRHVRSQSQGWTPDGGTAPTYVGSDGSSTPAPLPARSESVAGRRNSGDFGSREMPSIFARTTSLGPGGIHPADSGIGALGCFTSRQL